MEKFMKVTLCGLLLGISGCLFLSSTKVESSVPRKCDCGCVDCKAKCGDKCLCASAQPKCSECGVKGCCSK